MTNYKVGDRIESEEVETLSDDTIVWVKWVDGLAGPVMLEDFRKQGLGSGKVFELTVNFTTIWEQNKAELYSDDEGDYWRWREELNSWAYHDGVKWVASDFPVGETGIQSWGETRIGKYDD